MAEQLYPGREVLTGYGLARVIGLHDSERHGTFLDVRVDSTGETKQVRLAELIPASAATPDLEWRPHGSGYVLHGSQFDVVLGPRDGMWENVLITNTGQHHYRSHTLAVAQEFGRRAFAIHAWHQRDEWTIDQVAFRAA